MNRDPLSLIVKSKTYFLPESQPPISSSQIAVGTVNRNTARLHHVRNSFLLPQREREREREREMSGYFLPSSSFAHEDILICVDVDPILDRKAEVPGYGTNMDCTRSALRFFVHAKLAINPGHRFAFCTLSQSSVSWVGREFSSNVDSVLAALLDISADSSSHEHADVTQLFQIAACEATRCEKESRILRVILIYCRSCVLPEHHWPVDPNLFTLDVVFFREDSSVENRRQNVYNTLVDAVADISRYAGYVIQCFHGLVFALLSRMCVLLSHPQQRTAQDEIDIPKALTMKSRKGKEVAFNCCW